MTSEPVPFAELGWADLVIDRVYRGGQRRTAADDPIAALLPVGNQGGFRYRGSPRDGTVSLAVLYTSGGESDWPDRLDPVTGDFTYFGDNRRPGSSLLGTPRRGNLLLQSVFAQSHEERARCGVPPFLLFQKAGSGRDVIFRGLLAPGSPRLSPEEELVAVWRTSRTERFQNYRAHFTVLDVPVVTRAWLNQILAGDPLGGACPPAWAGWAADRRYRPLVAPRTLTVRSPQEQRPSGPNRAEVLAAVYQHFKDDPTRFESFAADLWLMADSRVVSVDVTRPSRDGGRDAIGSYAIGPRADPISLTFALEAKCYLPNGRGVTVRDLSRLISRILHRQFGVLVTTSHLGQQAYQELREDGHPVVVIAGADIVEILASAGMTTAAQVREYLATRHPMDMSPGSPPVDIAFPAFDVTAGGSARHDPSPVPVPDHPAVPAVRGLSDPRVRVSGDVSDLRVHASGDASDPRVHPSGDVSDPMLRVSGGVSDPRVHPSGDVSDPGVHASGHGVQDR